jgi:hypothetical protein
MMERAQRNGESLADIDPAPATSMKCGLAIFNDAREDQNVGY